MPIVECGKKIEYPLELLHDASGKVEVSQESVNRAVDALSSSVGVCSSTRDTRYGGGDISSKEGSA